ncbi:hypothetical protein ANCDUO_09782 [Ancylostoma duodenale]|uniref:Uncharacterized protein n=1 Tax=Ancylostoma duodenale TaxID=51022 RepID=A0A0C2GFQ9_9BILA|nr:hypothetical protein ANCDUO_09782 [Ancylostoma duodenale]
MDNNRVFMEEGTPEATAQYYQPYVGAAAAKYLYGVLCYQEKSTTHGTSGTARFPVAEDGNNTRGARVRK